MKIINYSILILMLLMMMSACDATSSGEEKEEVITPVEHPFYAGYWRADMDGGYNTSEKKEPGQTKSTSTITPLPPGNEMAGNSASSYYLEFYRPANREHYIGISNSSSVTESEISWGDEVYVTFSVLNSGSSTFSVHLGAPEQAEVVIEWDGVEYDSVPIETLQANYYETRNILISDFWGDVDMSPGRHEIELTLVVPEQTSVTTMRRFQIAPPDIQAEKFEFAEKTYFIENNGEVIYGDLSKSGNTLYLEGYGTLEVVENNGDQLIVSVTLDGANKEKGVTDFLFALENIPPSIPDNPTTNLLVDRGWILQQNTLNSEAGDRWFFTSGGNYHFVYRAKRNATKSWGYVSPKQIKFGFTSSNMPGTTEIVELTRTRMVMNDGSYDYIFEVE